MFLFLSLFMCSSQVGTFLKSPKFPIWILGSETHLSVFFTKASSVHSSIREPTHISHANTPRVTQVSLLSRLNKPK